MASERYARLISGSDLRGVALPGYGKEVTLTPEDAAAAARAFARMLMAPGIEKPRVALGHDPRLSWEALREGVLRGLAAGGALAIDCGLTTTPAMFTATIGAPQADGSIMLTASHLPPERNGLKFFTRQGGLNSAQLRALVQDMAPVGNAPPPPPETFDLMRVYASSLKDFISGGQPEPLKGMRIALDAGNGSGGFFSQVLTSLGAEVIGLYLEPDGRFPNHPPNPEEKSALNALSQAILLKCADLGVIFDADCDRAALVDAGGGPINRDRLIAFVAALLLNEHPGATIVTDSVTSTGLADFIRQRGGAHRRFKRGYRNIIDEAIRLNAQGVDCPGAIETSGHCALRENHFLDDGAYLVARMLRFIGGERAAGRDWTQAAASLRVPAEDIEIRLPLTHGDFAADAQAALASIEEAARADASLALADDSAEGVRVYCPQGGWFMARKSVHDPVLPVNIQADHPGGAVPMARRLIEILQPFSGPVDLSPLEAFVSGTPG